MAQKLSTNMILGWIASLLILAATVFTVIWAFNQGEFQFGATIGNGDEVSTTDWVEYRNEDFGFELMIPAEVIVQERTDNFIFKGGESEFQIYIDQSNYDLLAAKDEDFTVEDYLYLDLAADDTTKLAGEKATVYESAEGYCDMGSCGLPYLAYAAINNDAFFTIVFLGDIEVSAFEAAVFDTIDFFDVTKEVAEEPEEEEEPAVPAAPASPTADWETYTNTTYGLTFKYPKGASVDEGTINNPSATGTVYAYGTDFGYPVAQEDTLPYLIWSVANNEGGLTLNGYFDTYRAALHTGDAINKNYKIGAANIPAINVVFEKSPQSFGFRTVYFLDDENRFHKIGWQLRSENTGSYDTFDLLLDTVKIL
ncbi:hypothetical protein ACFL1U_00160 [Patescibacteria group bacterium]